MSVLRVTPKKPFRYIPAVACLLIFYYLGLGASLAKSPTNDEPAHLLRAALLGQTGDLRYQTGHAPLSHRLMSFFITSQPEFPEVAQLPSWQTGDRLSIAAQLVWDAGLNVERFLFLGRLPILWLGLLLGAAVASWALAWHGRPAMIISLLLFSFSPNLIASSSLATTDLAVAATYFATIFFWWLYWHRRQPAWWLATAVFLGLALAAKITAVLLIPVLFLLTLFYVWRGRLSWRPLFLWLGLLPLGLFTLWVVYGFEIGQVSGLPFSVPAATYIGSWQNVLGHVERGHQAFFLGDLSPEGWWYYFPVTFLIKTPLLTLILIATAIGVVITRRALWLTAVFLLLPVLALFAAAMTSGLNIGYRHILPALPFVMVFAASSWLFFQRWLITRALLVLGFIWFITGTIMQQPDQLAFFNEITGGTERGYLFLGDSNLDWGQDINQLATYVQTQPGPWLISYAGVGDPHYYGIPEDFILDLDKADGQFAKANPPPGNYAISANNLQGNISDADFFDWFRRQEPIDNLGGSILIYEVLDNVPGEWAAFCLDPAPLLSLTEVEAAVGQSGLRSVLFDCHQSWVWPDPAKPGWFILPQADSWWPEKFLNLIGQTSLRLVYRHRASADSPSYDIYYWPGGLAQDPIQLVGKDATLAGGALVSLPYALNDSIQLASYQLVDDDWVTTWTIQSSTSEPFSLRAHLYPDPTAAPIVGDTLGYTSEQWQLRDFFIQRFDFPEGAAGSYLETGVYNYLTQEVDGDLLQLSGQ